MSTPTLSPLRLSLTKADLLVVLTEVGPVTLPRTAIIRNADWPEKVYVAVEDGRAVLYGVGASELHYTGVLSSRDVVILTPDGSPHVRYVPMDYGQQHVPVACYPGSVTEVVVGKTPLCRERAGIYDSLLRTSMATSTM